MAYGVTVEGFPKAAVRCTEWLEGFHRECGRIHRNQLCRSLTQSLPVSHYSSAWQNQMVFLIWDIHDLHL